MNVTITISEPAPGRIQCGLDGIDDEAARITKFDSPEFYALPVPQRFGLTLNEMLKQTDLGKMIMDKCFPMPSASITIGDDDGGDDECEGSGPKYPCRCRITDPEGEQVADTETHRVYAAQAPSVSIPKIGRTGWANLEPDGLNVRIKLDDGSELMGYECWWEPIADTN